MYGHVLLKPLSRRKRDAEMMSCNFVCVMHPEYRELSIVRKTSRGGPLGTPGPEGQGNTVKHGTSTN